MKMLTKDSDIGYLTSLLELLEENGIPATIQGKETPRLMLPSIVAEPSLWIYLDEQFSDAVNLIHEPHYSVTTGIDIDEFYSNQLSMQEQSTQLNSALGNLAMYVIFILFVGFIFLKVVG